VVADLTAFKRHVMRFRNSGDWTLILAIHGSENRVAAQAPPNWQRNAVFYDAAAIDRLFAGDARWTAWRDRYGPNHLALVACQVSVGFERTLISNLTRHAAGSASQAPGPTQTPQGMGTGCAPMTRFRGGVRTRAEYQNLDPAEQRRLLNELHALNRRYGYYGAPPVPDDEEQILHYYFDEAPSAQWAIVEVGTKQADGSTRNTGIPFWDRTTGPDAARFRQLCNQGVGLFRDRSSRLPPAH
jgi:hypothetical protein